MPLPEDSVRRLARRLIASGTSPSHAMIRDEQRHRLGVALEQLAPHDREILVMRNLEQLPIAEIAAVLGLTEGAVKVRHLLRPAAVAGHPGGVAMTDVPGARTDPPSGIDPILADLVEQFLQRLQAGEALDPSGFAAQHPEHAESLRQLLPALEMMADLGRSPAGTARPATVGGTSPAPGWACWATSRSSARSAAGAWAWSMRPSRSRSTGGWP